MIILITIDYHRLPLITIDSDMDYTIDDRLIFSQVAHQLHQRGDGHALLATCAATVPRASAVMKDPLERRNGAFRGGLDA